jgi:hypothetical protein
MLANTVQTSEIAVYRKLFDEKYADLDELLADLPAEGLLWKPMERSPWKGELASIGWMTAHAIYWTMWLLRHAEWIAGRREWDDVDDDKGSPDELEPANHGPAYLRERVQRSRAYVHAILEGLSPTDLDGQRDADTVRYDIVHSIEHLSHHIGDAQLTRQLFAGQAR